MPAHVPRFLAAAVLALAACATARAQSFISFTTPDPVSAGHPFNLTVAGMLYATGAQPVPTPPATAEFSRVTDATPPPLSRLLAPGAALLIISLLGLLVVGRLGRRTSV